MVWAQAFTNKWQHQRSEGLSLKCRLFKYNSLENFRIPLHCLVSSAAQLCMYAESSNQWGTRLIGKRESSYLAFSGLLLYWHYLATIIPRSAIVLASIINQFFKNKIIHFIGEFLWSLHAILHYKKFPDCFKYF